MEKRGNIITDFFLDNRKIMWAIVINALVIFLMYFPQLKGVKFLIWVDDFFIFFFLFEVLIKIYHLGLKKYWKNGWNRFDFIIVVISLPSLAQGVLPFDTSSILVLRLIRLTRLIRFLEFVPQIQQVLKGLRRAIRASVFVFLVLLVFNFILALFCCHFYGTTAPQHFGNPLTASYTIFQLFTLEGWNEIPAHIVKNLDNDILMAATKFFFVGVVLVGGIFGISLANAIFVDEMTMDNNIKLERKIDKLQKEIQELKNLLKERG